MKNFLIIIIVFAFQTNILSQIKHQDVSKEEGLRSLVLFKEFLSIPNDARNKEDIFKRAKEMSPYFQDGLYSLKDLKEVVSIRGYGMMGGIEMRMKDKPGKSGFQTFKHCYDAGVNFKNTGDTLIIAPQFICEKKHIDEIIEKLRTGISNYSKS